MLLCGKTICPYTFEVLFLSEPAFVLSFDPQWSRGDREHQLAQKVPVKPSHLNQKEGSLIVISTQRPHFCHSKSYVVLHKVKPIQIIVSLI